jgi:hypothetical protein
MITVGFVMVLYTIFEYTVVVVGSCCSGIENHD